MRLRTLVLSAFASTVISPVAVAEDSYKIVDKPLELSIQMNHARYPLYREDWPVEQEARALTNIHLVDVTVGANMRTCLLYTSPSPRDRQKSRMPSSA